MTIAIRITPTLFIASGGKFRHDRRYLRASASGARFPIVRGATMEVATIVDGELFFPAVRWSVAGLVRQQTAFYLGDVAPAPVNAGSFDAAVTLVKI